MTSDEKKPPGKSSKGYRKRPVWFWILVYLIAAIIVYGVIYLLFMNHGGGNGGVRY